MMNRRHVIDDAEVGGVKSFNSKQKVWIGSKELEIGIGD